MSVASPIWEMFLQKIDSATLLEHASLIYVRVVPKDLLPALTFLAKDDAFQMDYLKYMTVIDWEDHFELVYHLYSYRTNLECCVSVEIARENPIVASCHHIWPAANWHEREMYDLFGVTFSNHPNLQRLLLPVDWVGHPLRKDFVEQDHFNGVSTTRNNVVKLPSAREFES